MPQGRTRFRLHGAQSMNPAPEARLELLCSACGLRARAPLALAGKVVPCPRCKAKITVPEHIPAVASVSTEEVESDGFEVEEAADLTQVQQLNRGYLERGAAEIEAVKKEAERPATELKYLALSRWVKLSLVWLYVLGVSASSMQALGGASAAGPLAGGAMVIASVMLMVGALALVLIAGSYAAACFLADVSATAHRGRWGVGPVATNPAEWFGGGAAICIALLASGAPGAILGSLADSLVGPPSLVRLGLIGVSLVVCLPVAVLSQLHGGSLWTVLSPEIVRSVLGRPGALVSCYAGVMGIALLCGGAMWGLGSLGPGFAIITAPIVAGAPIALAPLLGGLVQVDNTTRRTTNPPVKKA